MYGIRDVSWRIQIKGSTQKFKYIRLDNTNNTSCSECSLDKLEYIYYKVEPKNKMKYIENTRLDSRGSLQPICVSTRIHVLKLQISFE